MPLFAHSPDVAAGGWIAPRLVGGFGAVGLVCPTGFEAYARVFHPVNPQTLSTERHSWAEVAASTGRVAHPGMQWARISPGWNDGEPPTGTLEESRLAVLAEAIGGDAPITLGFWIGYGHYVRSGPELALPGREYALYRGSLSALRDPHWRRVSGWDTRWDETLNLAWPDDRGWFVASEIDFDSTIVGGSRALIDRVLASALETAEVTETTDLSSLGDRINP
jgi:hypothetical protein